MAGREVLWMAGREVLWKYHVLEFDPVSFPLIKARKKLEVHVRKRLPSRIRCRVCRNRMDPGTMMDMLAEKCYGEAHPEETEVLWFYFECTTCSAEMIMITCSAGMIVTTWPQIHGGVVGHEAPCTPTPTSDAGTPGKETHSRANTRGNIEEYTIRQRRATDFKKDGAMMKSTKFQTPSCRGKWENIDQL